MHAQRSAEVAFLEEYTFTRLLPDGRYIAVQQFMFTWGLLVDLRPVGYEYRYCYEHAVDALVAMRTWTGEGDPPGPWIKLKGHRDGDRLGPGVLAKEIT